MLLIDRNESEINLVPNEEDEKEKNILEGIDILELSKFTRVIISIRNFFKKYKKLMLKIFFLLLFFSFQLTLIILTYGFSIVPLLVDIVLSFNDNQGKITKISSKISLAFFIILLALVLISLILNILNIFYNFKGRKKRLQISLIIINFILNLIYSISCIYCYVKGLKNKNIRNYMDIYLSNKELRVALGDADSYNYKVKKNKSLFWSGLGADGEGISNNYAMKNNKETISMLLKQYEIEEPKDNDGWRALSAYYAMKSKGTVVGLIGKSVGQKIPERDTVIGDIWLHTEKPLLGINTDVKKVKLFKNYNETDSYENIEKIGGNIFETFLSLFSGIFQILNLFIN